MTQNIHLLVLTITIGLLAIFSPEVTAQPIPIAALNRSDSVSFEKEIVPIMRRSCLACHNATDASGELVLESPESIRRGGDSGPAIVAGKSAESLLLKLASHQDDPVMPPEGNDVSAKTLTSQELGLIKLWIDQGAQGNGSTTTLSPEQWRPLPPGQHPIGAVAVSPDGQFAACGRANQIFIYHVATGQLVTRLTDPALQQGSGDGRPGIAHLDVVQSLSFSNEGDMLASGGFRTAKLWRYPRDVQLRAMPTDAEIQTVAVSPDRSRFATGGADGKIRLWSLETKTETAAAATTAAAVPLVLTGHTGEVRGLYFTRDGQQLISTSADKSILVWAVADGSSVGRIDTSAELHSVTGILQPVLQPIIQPAVDGATAAKIPEQIERLVTGGADNFIRIWNIPRSLPKAMADVPAKTKVLAASRDGKLLALGTADGIVRVVDSQTNTTLQQWPAHEGPIHDIAFGQVLLPAAPAQTAPPAEPSTEAAAPFERRLATAGADGEVRLWSLGIVSSTADAVAGAEVAGAEVAEPKSVDAKEPKSPVELMTLRGSLVPVRSIDFRADGKQLVAGAEDGAVTIWNTELRGIATDVGDMTDVADATVADATVVDASVVAPADTDTRLTLPAIADSPAPAGKRAQVIAVSPDSKLLASTSSTNGHAAILVRDIATGEILQTLLGHSAPVVSLAFSKDNRKIVSGSADMTARVWDLASPKFPEIARFSDHTASVTSVTFNSDAQQVLSGSADKSVKLWKVVDSELVMDFPGHTGPVVAVAMLANNQPVSASIDKTVRFWNLANGQVARTQTEPAAVTAMSLSRDGARVAIAAADKSIRVYAATGGAAQLTMTGHKAPVNTLAFNADNTRLVSGDPNAAIAWDTSDGRLLEVLPSTPPENAKAGESLWTGFGYVRVTVAGQISDRLVLADDRGQVTLRSLRFTAAARGMKLPITAVVWHPNSQLIIAGCADGTVRGFAATNTTNYTQTYSANHGAPVNDIALDKSGTKLATAGENKIVRIWNPANGAALAPTQLTGLAGPVRSVDFSVDGQRVLASSVNGAVGELIVFQLAAPAAVIEQSIVGHSASVGTCLVIEGNRAVSLSDDGMVLNWELLATQRIAGHTQAVTSVSSIPLQEGQPPQILSGSLDGSVRRWNSLTGQLLGQMNHGAPVTSVAVRGDGQRWASSSANNTIRLWGVANNQIAQMTGDLRAKSLVAQLTQQKNDATAKVASAKVVLDTAEKALPVKTAAEKAAVTVLATADTDVAAKAALLTTASSKKAAAEKLAIETAALAQSAAKTMETANELARELAAKSTELAAKAVRPRAAASVNPDNAALAKLAATAAANAQAADVAAKAAEAARAAPIAAATKAAQTAATAAQAAIALNKPFTDADVALALSQATQRSGKQAHEVAGRDLRLATEDIPAAKVSLTAVEALLKRVDGELVAAVEAEKAAQQPVRAVAFSPDNQTLVTGGDFGVLHTWNSETGAAISSYQGHTGPITTIAYVDNDRVVSSSSDKNAVLWDLNPKWQLARVIGDIANPAILIDRVASVDISSDEKRLVTGGGQPSRSGEVKIWNISDGALLQEILDPHTDAVTAVAFSPDDRFVASASADKYIKKFETSTGKQVAQFEGHTNYALGVSWRGNGQVLASCGADGTIRLWNAETGDSIRIIRGLTKQVSAVRFVGETQFAVVATGQALVRKYNTDNGGVQTNYAGPQEFMFAIDATGDPNNGIVVAGGYDGQLRIWRANGPVIQTIGPPQEPTDELTQVAK